MTEALSRIQRLAPGISFELLSNVHGGPDLLERGEIDFSIIPSKYLSPTHPSERLFDDEFRRAFFDSTTSPTVATQLVWIYGLRNPFGEPVWP